MYENFHIIPTFTPPRLYFQILHSHFDDDYLFHQQNTKVKKRKMKIFACIFAIFQSLWCVINTRI